MFSYIVLMIYYSSIFLDTPIYHSGEEYSNLYEERKTEPWQKKKNDTTHSLCCAQNSNCTLYQCTHFSVVLNSRIPEQTPSGPFPVLPCRHLQASFSEMRTGRAPILCSPGASVLKEVLGLPTRCFCQIRTRK